MANLSTRSHLEALSSCKKRLRSSRGILPAFVCDEHDSTFMGKAG